MTTIRAKSQTPPVAELRAELATAASEPIIKNVTPISDLHINATVAPALTADYRRVSTGVSGLANAGAGAALLSVAAGTAATIGTAGTGLLIAAGLSFIWWGMRGMVASAEPPGVGYRPNLR
jgi:hypothetical protein